MPLVRKLVDSWHPAENPNLQVGETTVISDPRILLQNRIVILVDDKTGKDIPFSSSLDCQFCAFTTTDLEEYTKHLATHVSKPKTLTEEEVDEIVGTTDTNLGKVPQSVTELESALKTYKCKKCDFTTQKVVELAQHARLKHPSNVYVPSKPNR